MDTFKIGVLRETKVPPDRRVALPPKKILQLLNDFPSLEVVVQPSPLRCFKDEEYTELGIHMQEDLSGCDLLVGVKEVEIESLIPDKAYVFFAHVAKEQPYNRDLLQAILQENVKLMDYEYFTDDKGVRLIAFGRWAGIVGAYNGLRGLGIQTGKFSLKPANVCHDRQEMNKELQNVILDQTRILVSGGGRVAMGAIETLRELNIREVAPAEFLSTDFDEAVICRIDPDQYAARKDGSDFDLHHFFDNPEDYVSTALPYLQKSDLYVAAHYWDPDSPRMFELDDLEAKNPDTRQADTRQADTRHGVLTIGFPKVIADISCDIDGSVPTTTHATTIAEPFYYYDVISKSAIEFDHHQNPHHQLNQRNQILMMTVDNLPGELPRDASEEFSGILIKEIIPRIIQGDPDGVIKRATITEGGKLTDLFSYLEDYSKGL